MSKIRGFNPTYKWHYGGSHGMRFVTNICKSRRTLVLEAAKNSGTHVEFRETPNGQMSLTDPDYANFGSIWTDEPSLRDFWAAFNKLREESTGGAVTSILRNFGS